LKSSGFNFNVETESYRHPQLLINWELDIPGIKFKRIEQFDKNLLLVEETNFYIS
jgi:hypothetical protein